MDPGTRLARSADIDTKVNLLLRKRTETAAKEFNERVRGALGGAQESQPGAARLPALLAAANPWTAWQYAVDAVATICEEGQCHRRLVRSIDELR